MFLFLLILSVYWLVFPKEVSAVVLFEDDFSTGLSKWNITRGELSWWSTEHYKAEVTIPQKLSITDLVPKDEYWDSSWKNYIYEVEVTPLEGVDRNIVFRFHDNYNWQQLHLVTNSFNLVGWKDGSIDPFLNILGPRSISNHFTYKVKVIVNEATVTIFINGKLFIEHAYNGNFDIYSGKIALRGSTGTVFPSKVSFDNVVVRSIDDPEVFLNTPIHKQNNTRWKDKEYDTALQWSSQPTIGEWGCALTSLVMLFEYYDLVTFPNGLLLNVDSMNEWLKSQPDGYIGEGLVNWVAATRLTKKISDRFGTPKLEYKRLIGPAILNSIERINSLQPTILEIPGHFMLSTGYSSNKEDIYINDPLFSFQKLSQHQKPLLSTLTFTPSQTDLSYLLIIAPLNTNLELLDLNGNKIPAVQVHTESIKNASETQLTSRKLLEFPKPASGYYQIKIIQSVQSFYPVSIWAYDFNAEPTLLEASGSQEIERFIIKYQKEGGSSLVSIQNQCVL